MNEKRVLHKEFSFLESDGDFHVEIVRDSAFFVVLHGETNILPEVITHVSGSTLKLFYGNYNMHYLHGDLKIYVHMPVINSINLQGTGSITSSTPLVHPLVVTNGSSGSIDLNCSISQIITNITGPGKIILHGEADGCRHLISGSGGLDAFDLKCAEAEISLSGSGTCTVYVTQGLKVDLAGSGSVRYMGSPVLVSNITGSGTITRN